MDNRILELALETLQKKKAEIEQEITQFRSQLGGLPKKTQSKRMKAYWERKRVESPVPARKRRKMTAAQKKAVGARMKAYWAKRKSKSR